MSFSDIDDDFLVSALDSIEKNVIADFPQNEIHQPKCTAQSLSVLASTSDSLNKNLTVVSDQSTLPRKSTSRSFSSKLTETLKGSQQKLSNYSRKIDITTKNNHISNSAFYEPDFDDLGVDLNFDSFKSKRKNEDSLPSGSYSANKVKKFDLDQDTSQKYSDPEKKFPENNQVLNNIVNQKTIYSSPSNLKNGCSSSVTKRKFPGPAGLLPQLNKNASWKSDSFETKPSEIITSTNQSELCSQSTARDFVSGSWRCMLEDTKELNEVAENLKQRNLRWLVRRANFGSQTAIRKVPFLGVMIRSVDSSHPDVPTVFQDESGTINGALSSDVIEKYSDVISVGATLLLKDVTLLSPSFQGVSIAKRTKKHFLNITLNSILTIYSPHPRDPEAVFKTEVVKVDRSLVRSLVFAEERTNKRIEVVERDDMKDNRKLFESFGTIQGSPIGPNKSINRSFSPIIPGSFQSPNPCLQSSQPSPLNSSFRPPTLRTPRTSSPNAVVPSNMPTSVKSQYTFKTRAPSPHINANSVIEGSGVNSVTNVSKFKVSEDDDDDMDDLLASLDTDF